MQNIKRFLKDNRGDTNLQMMIIVVISFVAGAILLAAFYSALDASYRNGHIGFLDDVLS